MSMGQWWFARRAGVARENRTVERIAVVDPLPTGAAADMRFVQRQQRRDDVSQIESSAIEAAYWHKRSVRP